MPATWGKWAPHWRQSSLSLQNSPTRMPCTEPHTQTMHHAMSWSALSGAATVTAPAVVAGTAERRALPGVQWCCTDLQVAGTHQPTWVVLSRYGSKVVVGDRDHDTPTGCICSAGSNGSVSGEGLVWPVLVAHTLHSCGGLVTFQL